MSFLTELITFAIVGDARYGAEDYEAKCNNCGWNGYEDETIKSKCPRCKTITKVI